MKHGSFVWHLFRLIRKFIRVESGMTLPLLAGSMVIATSMVGLAIDVARMQLVQSKLQFSLDAAGLAGGSTVSTADLTTEVNKYLYVNFNNYLGATVTNVVATPNSTTTLITLTATATLPTTFMQVLGISTITVNANSQVTRQIAGLEVTVVIDVSYGDDLTDFKAGLLNFIQTLFSTAAGVSDNLYVAVVPFNQTVNIGTGNTAWMDPNSDANVLAANPEGWGPPGNNSGWGGCVMARTNGEGLIDDPPSAANPSTLFEEDFYPPDTPASLALKQYQPPNSPQTPAYEYNDYTNWTTIYNANQQTDGLMNPAILNDYGVNLWYGTFNIGGVPNTPYYASPLNTENQGPNFMCPPPIQPLTNNETDVLNTINSVDVIQGDWSPDQGLEWGWNTLSPRWQGLWGGVANANGLPLAYSTPGWNKAVVWVEGITYAEFNNVLDNNIYSDYGYLWQNTLGTTDAGTAMNDIMNNAQQVCNSMLANNIYIYVLGYSANNSYGGLMPVMQNCATAQNYTFWFGPGDWNAFDTALNSIADSLVNLRVSK